MDGRTGLLTLAWADGAQVREADGVRLLPRGAAQLEPLRAGRRLDYGDLLVVPAKAAACA
jgi:hypothetical protein